MKKLFTLILLVGLVLINIACSDEPPSIRVKNERTNKANVQVKQTNGNTINFNDVSGGTTTAYREIVEGATIATAVIQNEQESPSASFTTYLNKNYTIVITSTNPATLRIDSSDK